MLIFALALLAADPAPAPAPAVARARVLVTDAKGSAGRDVKGLVSREVAAHLTQYPAVEALAWSELRRMVELQSERQLTSCDDSSLTACLAELQSALGVPWAIFIDVDEVGGLISVGLTLIAEDHTALAREALTLSDPAQLGTALTAPLRRLMTPLHAAIGADLPATSAPPTGLILMGSGAVVVVAGAVVGVVGALPWFAHDAARAQLAGLRAAAIERPEDAPALLDDAKQAQTDQRAALQAWEQYGQLLVVVGAVGVGVGVVVATAGLVVDVE